MIQPILIEALHTATALVEWKARAGRSRWRRALSKAVFDQQFATTEKRMAAKVSAFLKNQVATIASRIEHSTDGDYHTIIRQAFGDLGQWRRGLIDAVVPVLSRAASESAMAFLVALGFTREKAVKSTASEWLEFTGDELPPGFVTDMPAWMADNIIDALTESFEADYWTKITQTTLDDVADIMRDSVSEGVSIRDMARAIREKLGDQEYYHNRSVNIARTESGNALNSARKVAVDSLMEELGPEVPMRPEWLSVLGTTTRDSHANLDGVPASKNGTWALGGMDVPWPGYWKLSPSERCNCMCSLTVAWGVSDSEADELIGEYFQRLPKMFGGVRLKFDPAQPRDDHGRFATTGESDLFDTVDPGAVQRISKRIAEVLGFAPEKIDFIHTQDKITVAGQEFTTGGFYYENTDRISINTAAGYTSSDAVVRIMSHEVQHHRWAKTLEAYRDETHQMASYHIEANGRLKPEFKKQFPVYDAINEAWITSSYETDFVGKLAKDDGVTPYSRAYWKKYEETKDYNVFHLAVNETLAEMAAEKSQTGEVPGSARFKKIYKAFERGYKRAMKKKPAAKSTAGIRDAFPRGQVLEVVMYFNDRFEPVPEMEASIVAIWQEGQGVRYGIRSVSESKGYNPTQPRDDHGRFATTGSGADNFKLPKVGEEVRVDGSRYWAESTDSDDAFPPAVARYEIQDGYVFYTGRNGSEGVVTGTQSEVLKWMDAVHKEVQSNPPENQIQRPWNSSDGGTELLDAAKASAETTASLFGIDTPQMSFTVAERPLELGAHGQNGFSVVNAHKNESYPLAFGQVSQGVHVAAHETMHAVYAIHTERASQAMEELRSHGKSISLYGDFAGPFEGLMELGAVYSHSADKLKQHDPRLFDIVDRLSKDLRIKNKGYNPAQPRDDRGRFATTAGTGRMVTNAKDAAESNVVGISYLLNAMKTTDPERYERWLSDMDIDKIRDNWLRQYRKRSEYEGDKAAFVDLNKDRLEICNRAIQHNAENAVFQAVVANGPPLNVIFMRSEKHNGANGEYKGGAVRIYDKWTDDPYSDNQGIGTAVLGGGVAGTIRHEYGHALHESKLTQAQKKEWFSRYHANTETIRTDISGYAATNPDEFFAEVFTMATHPKYNPETVSPFARESAALLMEMVMAK